MQGPPEHAEVRENILPVYYGRKIVTDMPRMRSVHLCYSVAVRQIFYA